MPRSFKSLTGRAINIAYGGFHVLRCFAVGGPAYRILLSPRPDTPSYEEQVSKGFSYTRYKTTYQEFEKADPSRFDLILPLGLPAVEFIASHPDWAPNNPMPTPSLDCIRLCEDKLALNQMLIRKGHGDLIPRLGPGLPMPYLIKKRTDNFGINTHLIRTAEDEQRLGHLLHDPGYFSQELVESFQEYAAHMVIRGGKLVCQMMIQHNLPNTMAITGKQSSVRSSHATRSRFTDQFVAALNAIGFEGLCCIDFRVVKGQPKLFEINPRMGFSLCPFLFSFVPALMRKG